MAAAAFTVVAWDPAVWGVVFMVVLSDRAIEVLAFLILDQTQQTAQFFR
ncbi:hypothetical protein JK191_06000, partial [Gluconobacter sphaericus]|nr:hypothetical protein [Gluconobacter sphaericus]